MKQFYVQTIEFDDTVVAGGMSQKYGQVDTGGTFIIESLVLTAWIPDAQTSIAGTPLPGTSSPTTASNSFTTLTQLTLQLALAGNNWFSSALRCNVFGSGNGNPFYFQTKPNIPPLGQIVGTLRHTGGANSVRAQVALIGYREV